MNTERLNEMKECCFSVMILLFTFSGLAEFVRYSLDSAQVLVMPGQYGVGLGGSLDVLAEKGRDGKPTAPFRIFVGEKDGSGKVVYGESVVTRTNAPFESVLLAKEPFGSPDILVKANEARPLEMIDDAGLRFQVEESRGSSRFVRISMDEAKGVKGIFRDCRYSWYAFFTKMSADRLKAECLRLASKGGYVRVFGESLPTSIWLPPKEVDAHVLLEGAVEVRDVKGKFLAYYCRSGDAMRLEDVAFVSDPVGRDNGLAQRVQAMIVCSRMFGLNGKASLGEKFAIGKDDEKGAAGKVGLTGTWRHENGFTLHFDYEASGEDKYVLRVGTKKDCGMRYQKDGFIRCQYRLKPEAK